MVAWSEDAEMVVQWRVAVMVVVAGLAWPAGSWAGEPTPVPAPAPEKQPAPAPSRVPDGVFVGTFATAGGEVAVRLVIVGGTLVDGVARVAGGETLALEAAGSFTTATLQAGGTSGNDYVRVVVEFFDVDRGAGTFEGVLGRQRTSGSWTVERR